jgi:hypothetical protein
MSIKKIRKLPTTEYLRACFNYDPDTGILTWRARPKGHFASSKNNSHATINTRKSGKPAGTRRGVTGYVIVTMSNKMFYSHRVIWKLVTGEDPEGEIDHRNRDKGDNRWLNLRQATHAQNTHNRPRMGDNTTGYKGVYLDKRRGRCKKWGAVIEVTGRRRFLGLYNTPDAAAAAYSKAALHLQGDYSCDNSAVI